jgi:hypothetical protein
LEVILEFLNWFNIGKHNTVIQGAMRLHDSIVRVIHDSADIIHKNAQLTMNLSLLELQNLGLTKLRKRERMLATWAEHQPEKYVFFWNAH